MTEQPFGQDSHIPGQTQPQTVENVYDQHAPVIAETDSMHETMVNQSRQISALMARLASYEKPQDTITPPPGGEPVAHHLHLVDGRVVVNHGGIGTHFSETLSDGSTRVTRVKEYFPANEPDPSTLNA